MTDAVFGRFLMSGIRKFYGSLGWKIAHAERAIKPLRIILIVWDGNCDLIFLKTLSSHEFPGYHS